jgi:hypothetical protein
MNKTRTKFSKDFESRFIVLQYTFPLLFLWYAEKKIQDQNGIWQYLKYQCTD